MYNRQYFPKFLSVPQLRLSTEKLLKQAERMGVECIEIYNALDRIEAVIPILKNRGDIELNIHECNTEKIYPGTRRISSRNPQVRKVVTEHLNWLIDMAGEVKARVIVLNPAFIGNSVDKVVDMGFGPENILPFEEARRFEVDLLQSCSERAQRREVILALENMYVKEESPRIYVVQTAIEMAQLIDKVNFKSLQCTYDVGHARMKGTSPIEYIKVLDTRIAHVHMKDSNESGGYLRLGDGDIDIDGVMRMLLQIDEQRGDGITVVLENEEDAGSDYKGEFEKLKKFRESCSQRK